MHLVDIAPLDGSEPLDAINVIIDEIAKHGDTLIQKPRWLIFNKCDGLDQEDYQETVNEVLSALNWQAPHYCVSALKSEGTQQVCYDLWEALQEYEASRTQDETPACQAHIGDSQSE